MPGAMMGRFDFTADEDDDDEDYRPRRRGGARRTVASAGVGVGALVVGVLLCCTIYWIPSGIAVLRQRTNVGPIIVINTFLGWTLIGFVIALSWAVATDTEARRRG